MFLKLRVPAKINLWLEVIRKREDGYHDLSTLMLPIGIHDELRVEMRASGGISMHCDAEGLPADSGNVAWRAAAAFREAIGSTCGIDLVLKKGIPVAAGLGGGSADAAGVLLALNRLHGGLLPMVSLERMASRIGADVPFFLGEGPALATGIGDRLEPVRGVPSYPLVLLKPPVSVSTGWVYQNLKLTRETSRISIRAVLDRPWQLTEVLVNDLETVTLSAHPELREAKGWLREIGAVGSLMSGSGPTVFGVFFDREHAREAAGLARLRWPQWWVQDTEVKGCCLEWC